MLATGGLFYQIRDDGKAYEIPGSAKTPFAVVTFFAPDQTISMDEPLSQDELQARILDLVPTTNAPYAVRIRGTFAHLKVRSVSAQEKPYPRLADATRHQVEFEHSDVEGTVVGFWTPGYLEGVNVPGFHLRGSAEVATRIRPLFF